MYKNFKVILFGILGLLVLSACQNTSAPAPSVTNGSDSTEVEVNLSNGNTLEFAYEQETDSVLVIESGEDNSASAIKTLADNDNEPTPLGMFWAFSDPGTPVPTFLTDKYGEPSGEQGSGINLLANTSVEGSLEVAAKKVACDDGVFLSALIKYLRSTNPFFKLNKKPSNYSGFVKYDFYTLAAGGAHPRYKFTKTKYVKRWYGSLCGRSVQKSTNNHYIGGFYFGPLLKWEYYSGGWKTWKVHEIPANSTHWYHYYWDAASPFSRRVKIERAMPKDQFDIAVDGSN